MDGMTQRMQGTSPDEESYSKMSEAPDGWKVESVNIRPAENGGFIANCSKTRKMPSAPGNPAGVGPSNDYQSKDYAFTSLPEVMAFLQTEFGGDAPEPAAASKLMA